MAINPKTKRPKNPDTPVFVGKYYLTNATLLPEVIKCKKNGKISNELIKMIMLLAERYSKSSKFAGYTFREDMVSEAVMNLYQNALKFNPEKSSNPFAFYTTSIHNSFLQFLNNEKKHRNIRDKMLIEYGENPSFNYITDHNSEVRKSSDDADDHHYENDYKEIINIKNEIDDAKERKQFLDEKEFQDKIDEEKLLLDEEDDIIKKKGKSKDFFKYDN